MLYKRDFCTLTFVKVPDRGRGIPPPPPPPHTPSPARSLRSLAEDLRQNAPFEILPLQNSVFRRACSQLHENFCLIKSSQTCQINSSTYITTVKVWTIKSLFHIHIHIVPRKKRQQIWRNQNRQTCILYTVWILLLYISFFVSHTVRGECLSSRVWLSLCQGYDLNMVTWQKMIAPRHGRGYAVVRYGPRPFHYVANTVNSNQQTWQRFHTDNYMNVRLENMANKKWCKCKS